MTASEATHSGPFGRGGGDTVRVQLRFHGVLTEDFAAFVQSRADRLSVAVHITSTATDALVMAEGSDAMIGALEMAACIGPESCRIDRWDCSAV